MHAEYFDRLERIVNDSTIQIDRPKDSAHPRYPEYIYPMDYGFLVGTKSQDGGGIDVWVGSGNRAEIFGVLVIADAQKKDSEIKVLLGCDQQEATQALQASNRGDMAAILITRTEQAQ